jgi:hypothetical protein
LIGAKVFGFVFVMWILILIGGGLLVLILGPISFSGYGDFDPILNSGVQVIITLSLWIVILSKIKNWIFKKQITY